MDSSNSHNDGNADFSVSNQISRPFSRAKSRRELHASPQTSESRFTEKNSIHQEVYKLLNDLQILRENEKKNFDDEIKEFTTRLVDLKETKDSEIASLKNELQALKDDQQKQQNLQKEVERLKKENTKLSHLYRTNMELAVTDSENHWKNILKEQEENFQNFIKNLKEDLKISRQENSEISAANKKMEKKLTEISNELLREKAESAENLQKKTGKFQMAHDEEIQKLKMEYEEAVTAMQIKLNRYEKKAGQLGEFHDINREDEIASLTRQLEDWKSRCKNMQGDLKDMLQHLDQLKDKNRDISADNKNFKILVNLLFSHMNEIFVDFSRLIDEGKNFLTNDEIENVEKDLKIWGNSEGGILKFSEGNSSEAPNLVKGVNTVWRVCSKLAGFYRQKFDEVKKREKDWEISNSALAIKLKKFTAENQALIKVCQKMLKMAQIAKFKNLKDFPPNGPPPKSLRYNSFSAVAKSFRKSGKICDSSLESTPEEGLAEVQETLKKCIEENFWLNEGLNDLVKSSLKFK